MGRRLLPLVLCCALVAGCGGDDDAAPRPAAPDAPRYTRAATQACLKREGFRIATTTKAVGFIASTAVGGALRAKKGRADVIMAFGADGNDAAQTLKGIKRFRKTKQSKIFRFRLRRANAVVLWAYRPTPAQQRTVYGCLQPSG